jgi:5'-3' exoribonuclease 1
LIKYRLIWRLGLKRLEDGSSVKDWEDADKETDVPLQLTVKEVNFEDERFKEQPAPQLSEEFPIGTTVFFLGEHAYGVVAQVHEIVGETLSVTLAVRSCPPFCRKIAHSTLNLVLPRGKS